jgi:DNA-binding response OmpR family regulator
MKISTASDKDNLMGNSLPVLPNIDVLIVEPDAQSSLSLEFLFSSIFNRRVKHTQTASAALVELELNPPKEVFVVGSALDQNLKESLITKVSGLVRRPFILIIDGSDETRHRISAYASGASEVVRTPFSLLELALQLQVKVGGPFKKRGNLEDLSGFDLDLQAFISHQANLTVSESQIAHILFNHQGSVVTRDDLAQALYEVPWVYGDRKFDVHIASIRKKLNGTFGSRCSVKTVRSVGYILTLRE